MKSLQYFTLFALMLLISSYKLLLLDSQLAYGDLATFPETAKQALNAYLFIWQEVSLGIERQPGYIFPLLQAVILAVLKSPLLSQKFFLMLVPFLSYLTYSTMLKSIFKNGMNLSVFTASLFYTFPPIFFLEFGGGTLYSTLIGYALFPLSFLLTVKLRDSGKPSLIILLALLLGLIFSINPHMSITYMLLILAYAAIDFLDFNNSKFKPWFKIAAAIVLCLFLNPLFFISTSNLITPKNSEQSVSFTSNLDSFLRDTHYTYHWSNLPNTLRLGNNYGSPIYTNNNFWTLPFFLVVAVVIYLALLKFNTVSINKTVERMLLPTYLAIVLFIYLTHLQQTDELFSFLPVLFTFRNPAKITYLATFVFCILLFKCLNYLITGSKKKAYKSLGYCLILITAVYSWPVLTGDWGLEMARSIYTIPTFFKHLSEKYESRDGRNLWLPSSHEKTSIKLVWLDRDKLEAQLGLNQFNGSYFAYDIVKDLNSAILLKSIYGIQNLLDFSQIDHIIILKDGKSTISLGNFYENGSIKGGSKALNTTLNFLDVAEEGSKSIVYKNRSPYPEVFTPSNVVFTDSLLSASMIRRYSEPTVVFDNSLSTIDLGEIKSEGNYISGVQKSNSFNLDDVKWNKGWSLPSVNTRPNTLKYFAVRIYENLLEKSKTDRLEKIDIALWNALKRPVELGQYDLTESEEEEIKLRFNKQINKLNKLITETPSEERTDTFWGLISKTYLSIKKVLHDSDNPLHSQEVKKLFSWIEEESCGGFCYEFETNFEGLHEIGILGLKPRETKNLEAELYHNKVSVKKVSAFYLKNGIFTANLGSLQPGKYNIKISILKGENLIAENATWETPETETVETRDGSLEYELNPMRPDKIKSGEKKEEEKKVEEFLWGHKVKEIESWEGLEEYRLSFDYNLKSGGLGVAVVEKLTEKDPESNSKFRDIFHQRFVEDPILKRKSGCTEDSKCFISFNKKVKSGSNTSKAFIYFYSFTDTENKAHSSEITNIEVRKLHRPSVVVKYLNNLDSVEPSQPVELNFQKISQVSYKVNVSNTTNRNFVIVLNQSFNNGWKLYSKTRDRSPLGNIGFWLAGKIKSLSLPISEQLNKSYLNTSTWGYKKLSEDKHYITNGFANAWSVDPSTIEQGEIMIYYENQNLVLVNIATGVLVLTYGTLLVLFRLKERRNCA